MKTLYDLTEAGIDMVIAQVPEMFASVKYLEYLYHSNNKPMTRNLAIFSPATGFKWITGPNAGVPVFVDQNGNPNGPDDPISSIRALLDYIDPANPNQCGMPGIFILPIYDLIHDPKVALLLAPATSYLRAIYGQTAQQTTIILETDYGTPIRPELSANAMVVTVPPPGADEIKMMIPAIMTALNKKQSLLAMYPDTISGLNRKELFIAEKICGNSNDIIDLKRARIASSDILAICDYTPVDNFDYLVGMGNLKDFVLRTAKMSDAKGILIVGVPGTGKSAFARAVGNHLKVPTVAMYLDRVFDKWVGSSESRIAKALSIIDEIGECVIFIDEIEKSIGGIASSHMVDGGTGSRVGSMFLKWLSDRRSRTYVIATSNNITIIPPEFIRAERWDSIFFVDVPPSETAMKIAELWFKHYNNPHKIDDKTIKNMTGAEIKTLARIGRAFDTLEDAAKYIVKIVDSMAEKISDIRSWAKQWACDSGSGEKIGAAERIGFSRQANKMPRI
jgi:hypothetical protein